MESFRYVIVGGGQSGDAAVKGIRSVDEEGSILLIGAEPHDPYERPPLSKGLWMGDDREDDVYLDTRDESVELWLGRRVTAVDPDARTVTDSQGDVVGYERLLLATGGTPRALPGLSPSERVLAYRTLDDYHQARTLAKAGARVVVIGGGFIGAEMAAGLRTAGAEVAMVFPEPHIGAGRFPQDLAAALDRDYRQRGVELHTGRSVSRASSGPDRVQLSLDDGTDLSAELVIVGIGTEPNVTLARELGLEVEGGIHVDRFLRTARPDIYACGDAMAFPHAALGRLRAVFAHLERFSYAGKPHLRALCAPFLDPEQRPSHYLAGLNRLVAAMGLRQNPVLGLVSGLLRLVDARLRRLHGGLGGCGSRDRRIVLLIGDLVLGHELLEPLLVSGGLLRVGLGLPEPPGGGQGGLGGRLVGLGALEGDLVVGGIEADQHGARLHPAVLLHLHRQHAAAHARGHGQDVTVDLGVVGGHLAALQEPEKGGGPHHHDAEDDQGSPDPWSAAEELHDPRGALTGRSLSGRRRGLVLGLICGQLLPPRNRWRPSVATPRARASRTSARL
ncbi:MAG: NAD(P)/FAD-dependent oxidoreductase [Deinococcales bacterium]